MKLQISQTCSAVFSTPRMLPSLDPANSQNRCLDLFMLCFSWISLTKTDPLRAIIAISDVGSFKGITGSACFVKTTLPSRNGGFVSIKKVNQMFINFFVLSIFTPKTIQEVILSSVFQLTISILD